ncbi:hypothetical protein BVY01_04175 [bacterium I07]|nr:hypothetical protein BVY01_04175 [bacterium I07]
MMCFLILGFLSGLLLPHAFAQSPVRLVPVLEFGSERDSELFQWAAMCTDNSGHVYITDMMDYSLKKFSDQGALIRKTGGKGKEPGKFTAPRLVQCTEKFVYVTDQYLNGIQVFNHSLDFQYRIPYQHPILDMIADGQADLWIESFSLSPPGSLEHIDLNGIIKKTIDYMPGKPKSIFNTVSYDHYQGDRFILAFKFVDRIMLIHENGSIDWEINVLGGIQSGSSGIFRMKIPSEVIFNDVAVDTSGFVYVLAGSRTENKGRDIFIISPLGCQRGKITLDETSHFLHIDTSNHLYVRGSNGSILKKYRIDYHL